MELKFAILPKSDLESIVKLVQTIRDQYQDSKIIIFGGTGFIGSWLTHSLLYCNNQLNLNLDIKVVTRNEQRARDKFPYLERNAVTFLEHDFSKAELTSDARADYVFHGATPTRSQTGSSDDFNLVNGSVNAAIHATRIRSTKFKKPRVIHLSSGAVYGEQPVDMKRRSEDDSAEMGLSSYAIAKVSVERILRTAAKEGKINLQSPRLFAFAGPLLQLDAHYAVGNFLLDGLSNRPIKVKGNPNTVRSYMYPSDLVSALLRISVEEKYQNFNIGSEEIVTMSDLAQQISFMTCNNTVEFTNPEVPTSNYVPSTANLKMLMPNFEPIGIQESLSRWVDWIYATDALTKEE